MAFGDYQFPQKSAAFTSPDEKGIASLYHPEVGTLRFRSNPNEFNWSYTLNKRVDQTYGGRVIQLLGTRIDDFTFKADSGAGRWEYSNKVARFMRDVMIRQRGGKPATFEYTTRGWKFNAFIVSVPFADAVEEVLREFEISMKVQEDVSGVMSKNTLSAELRRLQDGIAFRRSKYNDPLYPANQDGIPQPDLGPITGLVRSAVTQLTPNFLPDGLNSPIRQAQTLLDSLVNPNGANGG
jgi:hypothetical protein